MNQFPGLVLECIREKSSLKKLQVKLTLKSLKSFGTQVIFQILMSSNSKKDQATLVYNLSVENIFKNLNPIKP
jgi:vesicle coat complex subunit